MDSTGSWVQTSVDAKGNPNAFTVYYYGANGKRLGTYAVTQALYQMGSQVAPGLAVSGGSTEAYFGGRRLAALDRLGSVRGPGLSYFPYGEDKGTAASDTWKFGTYWRDAGTGLDYADQRFYSSVLGRFTSPDPYVSSAGPKEPGSWNRYEYVEGDPVNGFDPQGLQTEYPNGCGAPGTDYCIDGDWFGGSGSGGGLPYCNVDGSFMGCSGAFNTFGTGSTFLLGASP